MIKLAIDKYVEQSIYAQLDDTVEKIVDKRIDRLINGRYWDSDNTINGITFDQMLPL